MKKTKKYGIMGIAVLIVTAVVAYGVIQYSQSKDAAETTDTDEDAQIIHWQGKDWRYNKNISNYLLLGIDTREQADTRTGKEDAGQADAIFLLAVNRKSGTITMISIPRDTMTDIESFDLEGNSLGKSKDHISLSYGYGDGGQKSCKLTQEAVENLMYGLPIQGYMAMSMDGIPELTKSVGGVTVTVPNDSLESADPQFAAGAEVTLDENNTEMFVRSRDVDVSQSAIARMERQKVYLDAFAKKAKECYSEDVSYAVKLYQTLEPYIVTNIDEDRLARIFKIAGQGDGYEEWTIPGEGTQGTSYDEYQVDDDALYEQIIHTFYKEVK